MLFTESLQYLSLLSFLFTGFLAAWLYKRFKTYPAKAMGWYIFFNAIGEIESDVTRAMKVNNITHYYFYCLIETILVPVLFAQFEYLRPYKKVIYTLTLLLLIATTIEIYGVWPNRINTVTRVCECLFLVLLCAVTVSKIHHTPKGYKRFELEEFWLCQSIISLFGAHIIVILVTNLAITDYGSDFGKKIWMFNSLASIFSNCLLIYGIWKIYLHKPLLKL